MFKNIKRRKKQSLQLTDKKHPLPAIAATGMAFVSGMAFVATCFVSSQSHGKAGILIGLAGLCCFALAIAGFIISWMSLHRENIRPFFPTIASVMNGLLIIFYLLLYIWGTVM